MIDAICIVCGIPLTPEEAHYYEYRCERCEQADLKRKREWLRGANDPELDLRYGAPTDLLDALERETARADKAVEIAAKVNSALMADVLADRDRWKARAEALERALQPTCVDYTNRICKNYCYDEQHLGCANRKGNPRAKWRFNEDRFANP